MTQNDALAPRFARDWVAVKGFFDENIAAGANLRISSQSGTASGAFERFPTGRKRLVDKKSLKIKGFEQARIEKARQLFRSLGEGGKAAFRPSRGGDDKRHGKREKADNHQEIRQPAAV
jgi:hypothetical protein